MDHPTRYPFTPLHSLPPAPLSSSFFPRSDSQQSLQSPSVYKRGVYQTELPSLLEVPLNQLTLQPRQTRISTSCSQEHLDPHLKLWPMEERMQHTVFHPHDLVTHALCASHSFPVCPGIEIKHCHSPSLSCLQETHSRYPLDLLSSNHGVFLLLSPTH